MACCGAFGTYVFAARAADWRDRADALADRIGAAVTFENLSVSSGIGGDRVIEFQPVPEDMRAGYLQALDPALAAYSKDFLRRNLSEIAVYETMTVDGVPYGGTYDAIRKVVYLQGDRIGKPTAGFHHEFSSILLANYGLLFPAAAWREANPAGFRYLVGDGGAGAAALARNSDVEGGPAVYEKGFVAGYGMTRLEEDVNTYHQLLMADPARLGLLASTYPIVARKATLLVEFLKSIGCGCVPRFR